MKVLFINNDGGGFADQIAIPEGASVASLFAEKCPGRKASRQSCKPSWISNDFFRTANRASSS